MTADHVLTRVEDDFSLDGQLDIGRGINLRDEVERFESKLIKRALELTRWHQKRAARLLGLNTSTLHFKIKKYKLQPVRHRRRTLC